MPGTILENLSGRKLSILVAILLVSQLGCFFVGLIAPKPATSQAIIATTCLDNHTAAKNMNHWVGLDCQRIDLMKRQVEAADDIVSTVGDFWRF